MFNKIFNFFINLFSNLYIHKFPFFILYKPEMHRIKGNEVRNIINSLNPGDLIFRKHQGWLGSTLIPGYWSHVALYIGNDTIIHAIGEGVIKEDILTFCRTDCLCIKRIKDLNDDTLNNAIKLAENMVDKRIKYDYQFKDDNGKIYCTEMINECFNDLFKDEYINIGDNIHVLIPDDLYTSHKLNKIIEYIH